MIFDTIVNHRGVGVILGCWAGNTLPINRGCEQRGVGDGCSTKAWRWRYQKYFLYFSKSRQLVTMKIQI